MTTLNMNGLLIAGALLITSTAPVFAGDTFPEPTAAPSQNLTLPTIESAPWWLNTVRLRRGVESVLPIGQKVNLLDPKLLQAAPVQFAGRSQDQSKTH